MSIEEKLPSIMPRALTAPRVSLPPAVSIPAWMKSLLWPSPAAWAAASVAGRSAVLSPALLWPSVFASPLLMGLIMRQR